MDNNMKILEEKQLPKALKSLIDNSNKILQQTQQQLLDEINVSALEIMNIMNLKQEDGWRIDLGKQMFVRISIDENS